MNVNGIQLDHFSLYLFHFLSISLSLSFFHKTNKLCLILNGSLSKASILTLQSCGEVGADLTKPCQHR